MSISKRVEEITPFIVMDVLDRAKELERQGKNIIHLEVGEPDFDTPRVATEAGISAIRRGETHYTHSQGLIELREAVAEDYHSKYGVSVDPARVIITSGTSPAMLLIFGAMLETGEEVILPNPYYSCYPNFVKFVGGVPVCVNVYEDDGFTYRPQEIKKKLSQATKAIMLNSPSNPTGCIIGIKEMEDVAAMGRLIISDEIYHGLVYEGKEHSILEVTDNAFVVNGFSKLYAMTGWRLGYVIAPERFLRPMQKLQQNLFISASAFAQWAGIAALREAGDDVKKMVDTLNIRRKFMISKLRELGFGITVEPTGAFYVFANAKKFTSDSYRFAFDILDKAGVAVTPGIDFGSNGEGYIRFSYSNSIENIGEGMERIKKYLSEI